MQNRRNFHYDDRFNWPTGNPGDGKDSKLGNIFSEQMFDPRLDDRHYKSYQRHEGGGHMGPKDIESRRRVPQHSFDHQRRQERIIRENKSRWQRRAEPRTGSGFHIGYEHPVFGAGPSKRPGQNREQGPRRPGREKRLAERQRQEKELRESRKNYDLPGYNRPMRSEAAESSFDGAEDRLASKAWLDKRKQEDEQKYWHTWQTCPSQRQDLETAEDAVEEIVHGYESPRGTQHDFAKPPRPYDGGVRRFQTHSLQLAEPASMRVKRSTIRRKPSGMEKQYLLARGFTRNNRAIKSSCSDESEPSAEEMSQSFKRPTSLLQSHVFRSPPSVYADEQQVEQLEDIGLPKQPPRMKLAWHGLPRPVFKRFESIKRAVARKAEGRPHKQVQPPRFRMTVTHR